MVEAMMRVKQKFVLYWTPIIQKHFSEGRYA